MRKILLAFMAEIAAAILLTGCGCPCVEQDRTSRDENLPVIDRWIDQTCHPEWSWARTPDGTLLICRKLGGDSEPRWYLTGG